MQYVRLYGPIDLENYLLLIILIFFNWILIPFLSKAISNIHISNPLPLNLSPVTFYTKTLPLFIQKNCDGLLQSFSVPYPLLATS